MEHTWLIGWAVLTRQIQLFSLPLRIFSIAHDHFLSLFFPSSIFISLRDDALARIFALARPLSSSLTLSLFLSLALSLPPPLSPAPPPTCSLPPRLALCAHILPRSFLSTLRRMWVCRSTHVNEHLSHMKKKRYLLQNTVSFIGLFCHRDL